VDFEQLCQQGDEQELPTLAFFKADGSTAHSKRSKGCNLLERLIQHQPAVLAFAFEQGIPFTNNQAGPQRLTGTYALSKSSKK
jgi:hypothetical protein